VSYATGKLTHGGASLFIGMLTGSRTPVVDHLVSSISTNATPAEATDTGADMPLNEPGVVFYQENVLLDLGGVFRITSYLMNTGSTTISVGSWGLFWANWQTHAPADLTNERLIVRGALDPPLDMLPGDQWRVRIQISPINTFSDQSAPPIVKTADLGSIDESRTWGDRGLVIADTDTMADASLWFQPGDAFAAADASTWGDREHVGDESAIARESWFREDLGAEDAAMAEVATLLQSDVQVEAWSWTADRRHYLRRHPSIFQLARLINQSAGRNYDAEGRALLLRLLQTALAASHDLRPAAHYPQAQHATFGALRRVLWRALYGHIATPAEGYGGPLLTEGAADALTILETQDPLMTRPPDRVATLDRLLAGIGWRSDP
jgi:hypothetical protein